MARIRSLKPEFWTDEKVVSLSPFARLLFIGLWNFVDDAGRGEYSPTRLKMQILPADPVDISELLGEIRRERLVKVYSIEGKEYFEVCGFTKHQKVDKRTASKIPAPPVSPEFPRISPLDQGKEVIKEGKEENTDSKPNGHAYAFECGVVKLNERDLGQWRHAFPHVNVEAELTGSASWLSEQKSWFNAAAGLLAKRERAAKNRGPPRRRMERDPLGNLMEVGEADDD